MGFGESILIVDDIEEQRVISSRILERLGYRVRTVNSGEEAVQYLGKNFVDLLVLDMIMDPGMDGLETYKEILKLHPQQNAIIVSGFSESLKVKEALKRGAHCYIKKPYKIEKIGLAVRSALDQKKNRSGEIKPRSKTRDNFNIAAHCISNSVH
jgi:DNA-binding NtrC family response regulator